MAKGQSIKKEEVVEIKKWLAKGLATPDIEDITKRSAKTIRKVKNGGFDWMFEDPKPEAVQEQAKTETKAPVVQTVVDYDVISRLDQIIERLDQIIERMDTCEFLK